MIKLFEKIVNTLVLVLPSYRNQSVDLLDWFLYEGNIGN